MEIQKTTPEYDNYAVIEAGTHIGNIHNRSVDSVFRFEPVEDTWYTAEHLRRIVAHLCQLNRAQEKAAEAAEAALRG